MSSEDGGHCCERFRGEFLCRVMVVLVVAFQSLLGRPLYILSKAPLPHLGSIQAPKSFCWMGILFT